MHPFPIHPDEPDPTEAEKPEKGASQAVASEDPAAEGAPEEGAGASEPHEQPNEQPNEQPEEKPEEKQPVLPFSEANLPSTHRSSIADSDDGDSPRTKSKAAKTAAGASGKGEEQEKKARKTAKRAPKKIGKLVAKAQPQSRLPEAEEEEPEPETLEWYTVRVQSGREGSVRKALERKIREQGLGEEGSGLFMRVFVPEEQVVEHKDGKRREVKKKLYPGYVFVNMILNEDTRQLVRRISGVGDFVGTKLSEREVATMLEKEQAIIDPKRKKPEVQIAFEVGDKVNIKEGPFENFEGEIQEVNPDKGTVKVAVEIFNRRTILDIEYWKVEAR